MTMLQSAAAGPVRVPDKITRHTEWIQLDPLCQRAATCRYKRTGDVITALLLLLLLAPLLILIAITIRMNGGPVLFRQQRTGLGGKVFRIFKFRTMHVVEDGPDLLHASRQDRRTTRFGAVLRRSSLDELPQILNILAGDMSFVGPRPHALGHDRYYGESLPGYALRFSAKPGLTGLAQVRGMRGEIVGLAGMARRIAADREYISNWSLIGDLFIMLRTLPRLIHDRAAF